MDHLDLTPSNLSLDEKSDHRALSDNVGIAVGGAYLNKEEVGRGWCRPHPDACNRSRLQPGKPLDEPGRDSHRATPLFLQRIDPEPGDLRAGVSVYSDDLAKIGR